MVNDPFKNNVFGNKNFGFDQRTDAEKTRQYLTPSMKEKIKGAVGYKCEICRKKYPEWNLKVHHITEVSKAGKVKMDLNTPGNLVVICSNCHDGTHHKHLTKVELKEKVQNRSPVVKKKIAAILRNRTKVNSSSNSRDPFNFRF